MHRAETDVTMLLECAVVMGDQFVEWANQNAKQFCIVEMISRNRFSTSTFY